MAAEELGLQVFIDGFRKFETQMDTMADSIDDMEDKWEKNTKKSVAFGTALGTLVAAGITKAIDLMVDLGQKVVGFGIESVTTAISFESAFAGVTKTVDGLSDSTGKLTESGESMKQEFRDLAKVVPVAFEELAGIGELGGQLGVAEEDLIGFTETIAQLAVSTNLSSESAATSLAQIGNVMQSDQEDLDRFASTIVALGNNMATTEADIVNFSQRIAGAGAIAGFTEADIAGVGAAFSSIGVSAEAGGTAVQKVLLGINTAVATGSADLDKFAAAAGIPAEKFAALWEAEPTKAFNEFVTGLGAAGDDAILILEDLGLQDQRLIRSFLSMANAGDLLEESMSLSNEAFEDGTALAEEAGKRFGTTESQIQLLKNRFTDLKAGIGDAFLPVLVQLTEIFGEIIEEHGPEIEAFVEGFGEAIGGLVDWVVSFLESGGTLNDFLAELPESWQAVIEAVMGFVEFVQTNLVPIIEQLIEWFQIALPLAIDVLTTYFNDYLIPIIESFVQEFTEKMLPVLQELFVWLQENIPVALAFLADVWENILKPAMITIGAFIADTLIPLLFDLFVWLSENIPPTINALAELWNTTLLPALTAIWEFIQDNVIPIFEAIVDFILENFDPTVEAMSDLWNNTLLPAITAVWGFINDFLVPLFTAMDNLIGEVLRLTIEALVLTWNTTLLPALEGVWKFIKDDLLPIFISINDFIDKTLSPIIKAFTEGILSDLETGLLAVKTAVERLTRWIEGLIDKLNKISIPSGIMPRSVPPMAQGLQDISDVMEKLSTQTLPQFTMALQMPDTAQFMANIGAIPLGANGGNTSVSSVDNRQFNLTTQSMTRQGGLANEFRFMEFASR